MIHTLQAEILGGDLRVEMDAEMYTIKIVQRYARSGGLDAVLRGATLEVEGMDVGPDMLREIGLLFQRLALTLDQETEEYEWVDDEDED